MRALSLVAAAFAFTLLILPRPAPAGDATLQELGETAVRHFLDAVASADAEILAAVLAPEFQIMRANGAGYTRAEYLTESFPSVRIAGTPVIEELVATRDGDLLVTRYKLAIEEEIEGQHVSHLAPRLTVFRRVGSGWLVVAHANFAQPES